MPERETISQFTVVIGVDNSVSIMNEDATQGYGWGPNTPTAREIINRLEDEGMI